MSGQDGDSSAARDRATTKALQIGVPVAVIATAVVAGALQGPPAVLLVLAGGALIGVIATFWSSVRTLAGETPLEAADAYALAAPRAEEEQKRAVIRALKDLEFERSVGKISEEDFAALTAKYRAEAKQLLRRLDVDAEPRRKEIEGLVAKRLRREGLLEESTLSAVAAEAGEADKAGRDAPSDATKKRKKRGRRNESSDDTSCASCGTKNDADAMFCKKCGTRRDPATNVVAATEAKTESKQDEEGDS